MTSGPFSVDVNPAQRAGAVRSTSSCRSTLDCRMPRSCPALKPRSSSSIVRSGAPTRAPLASRDVVTAGPELQVSRPNGPKTGPKPSAVTRRQSGRFAATTAPVPPSASRGRPFTACTRGDFRSSEKLRICRQAVERIRTADPFITSAMESIADVGERGKRVMLSPLCSWVSVAERSAL